MPTDDLMSGLRELRDNVNPRGQEIIDRAVSLVSISDMRDEVFQAACDFVSVEERKLGSLFNTDPGWLRLRDAVYQFAHLETVEEEAEHYQPPTREEVEAVRQQLLDVELARTPVSVEPGANPIGTLIDVERRAGDAWIAYCTANGLDSECRTCNEGGHQCGGCGHSIAHGASDCAGAGGPGCPVHEELYHDPRPVRADRLMKGDEIFSDAAGKWFTVSDAGAHEDTVTIGLTSGFRFRVTAGTEFSTKPGETHHAVIASGLDIEGVVKSS